MPDQDTDVEEIAEAIDEKNDAYTGTKEGATMGTRPAEPRDEPDPTVEAK